MTHAFAVIDVDGGDDRGPLTPTIGTAGDGNAVMLVQDYPFTACS